MSHHTANYGADVLAAAADGFLGRRQPATKTDVKEDRHALFAPGSTRHLSRRGETRTGDAALQAVRRTHGDAVVAAERRLLPNSARTIFIASASTASSPS